ncbi:site-specific recombinase XerD [Mumia flava]|uniref:Site-specific recombinase XerD n=1 Tax=Mumia flava TaxID=1348852 RepID=A0A0B2BN84_9ACTN|nr:site-specific integrase [Mumia flava]PJJ48311.1 site-specific recombinase XerD [Mumia flava]
MAKTQKKATRRGFGAIRKLPSGRHQASYIGPDLKRHTAPNTFDTSSDAEGWLSKERKLMVDDEKTWTAPATRSGTRRSGVTLREYAMPALERRRSRGGEKLRPRTIVLYRGLLERVILPTLGDMPMKSITEADVEAWYDTLPRDTRTQNAHAYALLKSLFHQAIEKDRPPLATTNPCRISGADKTSRVREIRPITPKQLEKIVRAMPERDQALVLLAAWGGLRYGELAELRRGDLDLDAPAVYVRRAVVRADGVDIVGEPKSKNGIRKVALSRTIVPALREHLDDHVAPDDDALLFPHHPGEDKHLPQSVFYQRWIVARDAAGVPDLRVHDLRHTSAVWAARAGANLRELMDRLGHGTSAVALRYQHVAEGRDAEIADAMGDAAKGSKKRKKR